MRYVELIEDKLSFAHAKAMIAHLDTARGQALDVAKANPFLIQMSQVAARNKLGSSIDVFRAVTLPETALRPETVVSTSVDFNVAFTIATEAPGIIFKGGETLTTTTALLHYTIAPENVVLWVPAIMGTVKDAIGSRTNHAIEDRFGGRKKIKAVLDWMAENDENEIIADVTGLKPKVLTFEAHVGGRERLWLLWEVMRGMVDGSPASLKAWYADTSIGRHMSLADARKAVAEFQRWRA